MSAIEQGNRCREPVQEVATADRTDLAGAERARERNGAEQFLDGTGIVIGSREEIPAPTIAREQQCGVAVHAREQRAEVVVGRAGIAHVELQRCADLDAVADRDGPVRRSAPSTLRTRKSPRGIELVLVDDDADVQPCRISSRSPSSAA